MLDAAVEYVTRTRKGGWRIAGSRVSLDSVVRMYQERQTVEAIADAFPSLSPEQIHGAIAFYLRHQEAIDAYLNEQEMRWEALRQESERTHADVLERLRRGNAARGEPA